uniref:RRP12-like protein n=1 Tax=Hemiscolopendra marginata TaxID=943146 RepID=A0A646QJB6_9MYRI
MVGSKSYRTRTQKKKNKGKRWAKGQSSSSNPETTKYRDKVGNQFFNTPSGGNLTVGALQLHNDIYQESIKDDDDKALDFDGDTVTSLGRTQISKWTTCSLSAFSRFLNRFQISSALHKQMLAILEAISELVKSNGGRESETEYFLALMTTLEAVTTTDEQAACMSLLNILIKRVPVNILKIKFGAFSKTFIDLLDQHYKSENGVLIKHLISCNAFLLQVQELAEWQNSSTEELYKLILQFISHPKPRVRRASQRAVCFILKTAPVTHAGKSLKVHPASKLTAKFCIQELESYTPQTANLVLHILNLLREVLGYFTHDLLKKTCETILRLMTLGNVLITSCSLQVFHNLFATHANSENISSTLTQQLINALYNYVPSPNDSQPMIAWIKAMETANLHLMKLDGDLGRKLLPRLFQEGAKIWLSECPQVQKSVTQMFKGVLYEIVQPITTAPTVSPADVLFIQELFCSIETCLKFQYHAVWNQVLLVLAVFFEVAGSIENTFMRKCLQSLTSLRESHHFSYTNELNYAVGMAVRTMGPEAVVTAIPLEFKPSERVEVGFPHSWLIPVIRNNVNNTKLIFFAQYFLPLANACQSYAKQLESEGKKVEGSTYNLLYKQIWSLLPGFCTDPVDIVENFKNLAKILGDQLRQQNELRLEILSALRLLIKRNLENDGNKAELKRFAKNYVPILFNLYTIEPEGNKENYERLAVLETLKVYLQITPLETILLLFNEALGKMEDETCSPFKRHSILDLLHIMIQYVDIDHIKKAYGICSTYTQHLDRTVVKKTYRLLEELCSQKTKACEIFVSQNLTNLKNLLFSLESGAPATKAVKMRTLTNIVKFFPNQNTVFAQLIPKVILCVKEPSQKAKIASVALLSEMIRSYMSSKEKSEQEVLGECIEVMMAGLAVSPTMINATIISIGIVLQNFEEYVSDSLLQRIMKKINMLFLSEEKNVVSASVEFLKMLIPVVREDSLASHVETIVGNLMNISNEIRATVYRKTKEVFAKLIKKFGYSMILKYVPENHRKMLVNINKIIERRKRKQASKSVSEPDNEDEIVIAKEQTIEDLLKDSDSSEDEDGNEERNKKAASQSKQAWIYENTDQSIVNFLDPSSSRNIQATRPAEFSRPTRNKNAGFEISSDGRLIITDPENEKETKQPLKTDTDENITKPGTSKRKLDDLSDAEDYQQANKYQAGGTGIHRPIKQAEIKKPGVDFKAKKAGGDIKKKGQPDPYAYIPLDRTLLNRRKKAKGGKQYKKLLRAANKGARKGAQQHFRSKKKKPF